MGLYIATYFLIFDIDEKWLSHSLQFIYWFILPLKKPDFSDSEPFSKGDIIATQNMVALVNIDGMNVLDKVDYSAIRRGIIWDGRWLGAGLSAQQRRVRLDPRPQNALFFRSDQFSLAKQGVLSWIFISLRDTAPDYISWLYRQQISQSWRWRLPKPFPTRSLGGLEQAIKLLVDIVKTLAHSRDWPKCKMDSDFKAVAWQIKPSKYQQKWPNIA